MALQPLYLDSKRIVGSGMEIIQNILVFSAVASILSAALLFAIARNISYYHFFSKKDKKINKNQLNRMFIWGYFLVALGITLMGTVSLIIVFNTYP